MWISSILLLIPIAGSNCAGLLPTRFTISTARSGIADSKPVVRHQAQVHRQAGNRAEA